MAEVKKEFIEKIAQLKPIDMILIQNMADGLLARDKLEASKKKELVQQ